MANVDNPNGFTPVDPCLRVTRYPIEAAYATSLFVGDMVDISGGYVVKATAGAGNQLLGAIVGFECDDGGIKEGGYYPASSSYTWYALVADHPNQRFVAQDDGVGTDIALTDVGELGQIIAGTAGNENTNLSIMELDGSSFGTGSAANSQVRLIDLDRTPDNAVGDNARWVVEIHDHALRQANHT